MTPFSTAFVAARLFSVFLVVTGARYVIESTAHSWLGSSIGRQEILFALSASVPLLAGILLWVKAASLASRIEFAHLVATVDPNEPELDAEDPSADRTDADDLCDVPPDLLVVGASLIGIWLIANGGAGFINSATLLLFEQVPGGFDQVRVWNLASTAAQAAQVAAGLWLIVRRARVAVRLMSVR